MEVLIFAAILGIITGAIADKKGRSFAAWWLFGSLLFIVALPMALLASPEEKAIVRRGQAKRCPLCAELVKPQAIICRYCGSDLPRAPESVATIVQLQSPIFDYVATNPEQTSAEIARGTGLPSMDVRRVLDQMRKEGLAVWGRGERWRLTAKGESGARESG